MWYPFLVILIWQVRPLTKQTQPYVQPLVPYINQATPYLPPIALALIALASVPVLFTFLVIAFFTAPVSYIKVDVPKLVFIIYMFLNQIWLTVGFFTAFIWIPIAIFAVRSFGLVNSPDAL